MFENLLSLGYLGVFLFSLAINLIPFLSPSNLIIAGAAGGLFPQFDLLVVALLVALGASIAKTIHFGVSYFAGGLINNRKMTAITDTVERPTFIKLGILAIFIVAVTPVPDDPVVIPLGLVRYNPLKFFAAYFSGKLLLSVAGVFIGQSVGLTMGVFLGGTAIIVISVLSTILIVVLMLKQEVILNRLKRLHL